MNLALRLIKRVKAPKKDRHPPAVLGEQRHHSLAGVSGRNYGHEQIPRFLAVMHR
jgi:hypothetical protein